MWNWPVHCQPLKIITWSWNGEDYGIPKFCSYEVAKLTVTVAICIGVQLLYETKTPSRSILWTVTVLVLKTRKKPIEKRLTLFREQVFDTGTLLTPRPPLAILGGTHGPPRIKAYSIRNKKLQAIKKSSQGCTYFIKSWCLPGYPFSKTASNSPVKPTQIRL